MSSKKIYGWDTSAKAGWVLVGFASGLLGLLACFLVNHNTSRFSRSMLCTGIGIAVAAIFWSLLVIVAGDMLFSALGLNQSHVIEYVST